ncbi:MAG TPA: sulfotransferase [Solirubrobacteraceae bacterium]|nr:sulfotransferase [Solirubrobacteraceae bacterium]
MAATTRDPSQSQSQSQPRPRIVYVMGAGRSGSTIFGVTLGNCEGVFYAGELDAWLVRSGEPQLSDPERERFWSGVRADVPGARELFGREAQRVLERTMSLARVHRWVSRRRLREPYRRVAEDLYLALWRATGGKVIVDTSHYPLRARELQAIEGIDLHLVYLVRDPQRVVASFKRRDVAQYSKSVLTTNVYLWFTNLLCVLVFARQRRDRRLFVRYEDFLSDPRRVLRTVLEPVGVAACPADLSALRTGVAFQGNRLIKSEVIALRRESATQRPPRSPLTSALQAPWRLALSCLRPAAGPLADEHAHAPAQ